MSLYRVKQSTEGASGTDTRFLEPAQPYAVFKGLGVTWIPCELDRGCFNLGERMGLWPQKYSLALSEVSVRLPEGGWLDVPFTMCWTCAVETVQTFWTEALGVQRDAFDLELYDHLLDYTVLQDFWCQEHHGRLVAGSTTVLYNQRGVYQVVCSHGHAARLVWSEPEWTREL